MMQVLCVNTTLRFALRAQQASTPHLLAACHARLVPTDMDRQTLQQHCVQVSHHVWHVVPASTLMPIAVIAQHVRQENIRVQ